MARHSSQIRLVRRACRRCRNYTGNIVSRCPSCGAACPRVRFSAVPLWLVLGGGALALIAWVLERGG